jgi:hypothetical protein
MPSAEVRQRRVGVDGRFPQRSPAPEVPKAPEAAEQHGQHQHEHHDTDQPVPAPLAVGIIAASAEAADEDDDQEDEQHGSLQSCTIRWRPVRASLGKYAGKVPDFTGCEGEPGGVAHPPGRAPFS